MKISTVMIFCSAALGLLVAGATASAATGTITKVNGNKAVVEFETTPTKGDTVYTSDGNQNFEEDPDTKASRANSNLGEKTFGISYSLGYEVISFPNGASNQSVLNFAGTAVWVWNHFELGPTVSFEQQTNVSSTSKTQFGGIAQYDFIKNEKGVRFVPGVFVEALVGTSSPSNSGNNVTSYGGGGVIEWYPKGDYVAAVLSAGYLSDSNSAQTPVGTVTYSSSRVEVASGIKFFF